VVYLRSAYVQEAAMEEEASTSEPLDEDGAPQSTAVTETRYMDDIIRTPARARSDSIETMPGVLETHRRAYLARDDDERGEPEWMPAFTAEETERMTQEALREKDILSLQPNCSWRREAAQIDVIARLHKEMARLHRRDKERCEYITEQQYEIQDLKEDIFQLQWKEYDLQELLELSRANAHNDDDAEFADMPPQPG